ncbi:MAG: hypothetical protein KA941_00935 [Flavobacteriales bacterium]|nr:hypothetical protein [Flavobacteriales bacterium]
MAAPTALRTEELSHLRKRFAQPKNKGDKDPWKELIGRPVTSTRPLMDYHDLLLFILAFPRDAEDHATATHELDRVTVIAEGMVRRNETHRHALYNSGMAGTTSCAHFGIDLVRWLTRSHTGNVALDSFAGEEDTVRSLLVALAAPAEREAMDDVRHGSIDRVRSASSGDPLPWLLSGMDASSASPPVRQAMWTSMKPYIEIRSERSLLSRTYCRGVSADCHYWTGGLRSKVDGEAIIRTPLGPPTRLSTTQRERAMTAARGILIGYLRETDTATLGDPNAIEHFDMGQGMGITLLTLPPDRRTSFDSYIGYVAFSNSVPVAYGGAWVFPGKTKVGINIFPAFRGGPSSFLFAQILRCYAQRFKVGCFEADNYQIGHGNADGIRSGAYWFYHRLGFRTTDPSLTPIEAQELDAMRNDRLHRTAPSVLRKLAAQPMRLILNEEHAPIIDPIDISEAVLHHLASLPDRDGPSALDACVKGVMRALNVRHARSWSDDERRAFEELAPAISLIPGLGTWAPKKKIDLVGLMRAKGRMREDRYINALRDHDLLLRSWKKILDDMQ